jgi:spoIIIJ-associated protein
MSQAALQRGEDWLNRVLQFMACPAPVTTQVRAEGHDPVGWLTIDDSALTPEQIQILTGERGEVLDALQFLANLELNLQLSQPDQLHFTIDLAGYRDRRLVELQALAETTAAQVRAQGQPQQIEGLSSAERRQFHHLLSDCTDLETRSEGREPHRYLLVLPKSSEP